MKIKITKGFCLGAGQDVQPGDVVEVSDKDAAIHFQNGRAVKAEDKAAQAKNKAEANKQNKGGEE